MEHIRYALDALDPGLMGPGLTGQVADLTGPTDLLPVTLFSRSCQAGNGRKERFKHASGVWFPISLWVLEHPQ